MGASDINDGVAESVPNSESNHQFSTPKWLTTLVVVMGVLILVGTAALLWVIVHRIMHPHTEVSAAQPPVGTTVSSSATPAVLTVPRRADEQIRAVVPRPDGTLAVTVVSPQGGGRILLWLPEQARLVAEFDVGSSSP